MLRLDRVHEEMDPTQLRHLNEGALNGRNAFVKQSSTAHGRPKHGFQSQAVLKPRKASQKIARFERRGRLWVLYYDLRIAFGAPGVVQVWSNCHVPGLGPLWRVDTGLHQSNDDQGRHLAGQVG